jgi:aerobic-type carbon monoxide dehydrogenase small subunit (CoxS/CutS family)
MTPIHAAAGNRHLPASGRPRTVRAMAQHGVDEGATRCTVALRVNGRAVEADLAACSTLAELLRDHLQLTGTKVACNQAACGACTVRVDGDAVFACHTLASHVHGSRVQTIEGEAIAGTLTPLQQALVARDAMQCGFCTPGMVMALQAALDAGASERDALARAIAGNLCRCGAYEAILNAASDVVAAR